MNTPTLTLAATLLFTSLLLPVAAQPGGRGDGEPLRAALAELTLTAEQQAAIEPLLAEAKALREARRDERPTQRQAHQQAMQELMAQESFDEAAALKLFEQRQQPQAEQQLAMMKLHHQIGRLLTAEQRAALHEQMQQQMTHGRGPKGNGRCATDSE